jgi:hypothetical protein
MTRFKKPLLVIAIVAVVAGGIVKGLDWFKAWFLLSFAPPKMMILASPDRSERVFLLEEGPGHDRGISLCVRSNNDTIVERVADFRCREYDAVWSGDGSVLAFLLNDAFVFAYDFKSGQGIPNGERYPTDRADQIKPEDVERIKALVEERGTPKYRIPCSSRTFVPMRYSEWRKFRAALWAGDHPGERNPWRK